MKKDEKTFDDYEGDKEMQRQILMAWHRGRKFGILITSLIVAFGWAAFIFTNFIINMK